MTPTDAVDLTAEIRRRIERRRAQEAADLAARRERFEGDCSWCFDEGVCARCERGRRAQEAADLAAAHAQAQARREARRRLMLDAGIPPRRWDQALETFPNPHHPALHALDAFLSGWNGRRGLILTGPFGTGKTGLLVGALRHCAERYVDTPYRLLFIAAPELLGALREGVADHSFGERLARVQHVRLLAVDDLGAERPTAWVREQLFAVVNSRYEADLPLFATTNLSVAQLAAEDRLGPRLMERLAETCTVIVVRGSNLRRAGLGDGLGESHQP